MNTCLQKGDRNYAHKQGKRKNPAHEHLFWIESRCVQKSANMVVFERNVCTALLGNGTQAARHAPARYFVY